MTTPSCVFQIKLIHEYAINLLGRKQGVKFVYVISDLYNE